MTKKILSFLLGCVLVFFLMVNAVGTVINTGRVVYDIATTGEVTGGAYLVNETYDAVTGWIDSGSLTWSGIMDNIIPDGLVLLNESANNTSAASNSSGNSSNSKNSQSNNNKKNPDRTEPRNLSEQFTFEEAQSGAGRPKMKNKINDLQFKDTHTKMEHSHKNPNGNNTTVHYWRNNATGEGSGFKFKHPK